MIDLRSATRWRSANRRTAPPPPQSCALFTAMHDGIDPTVVTVRIPEVQAITACRGCMVVLSSLTNVYPNLRVER